jgi:hypothetical protein
VRALSTDEQLLVFVPPLIYLKNKHTLREEYTR